MRIEPGRMDNLNIKTPVDTEIIYMREGQRITGRVVPGNGGAVQIITPDGRSITALLREGTVFPGEGLVTFEAAGVEDGMVLLRVLGEGMAASYGGDMLSAMAAELGFAGDPAMLEFLKNGRFEFSRNVEMLFYLLSKGGRQDLIDRLLQMFIGQDRLLEYLKNFKKEKGRELLDKLEEIFDKIKGSGVDEKVFQRAAGGMLRGLLVQFNHPFPLFYIPLPVMHLKDAYTGELWIEEDDSEGKYLMHLFIESVPFGRVEADISYDGLSMSVDVFCGRDAISSFEPYAPMLKDRLSSLGTTLAHFELRELKRKRDFTDLAAKYIHTAQLDIRV